MFKKLSFKLTFIIISVLIIVVLTLSLLTGTQIIGYAHKDFLQSSKQEMALVAENIKSSDRFIEENLTMLAKNTALMSADSTLSNYSTRSTPYKMEASKSTGIEREIYNQLEHYGNTHPDAKLIYLGTKDKGFVKYPDAHYNQPYDPTLRPWFINKISNYTMLKSVPYIDVDSKEMVITYSYPVNNMAGDFIGTVGIDMAQNYLSKLISNMHSGKSGYYMIIHNNGTILADPNNSFNVGTRVQDNEIEAYKTMFNTNESIEVNLDGENYYTNSFDIPEQNWRIFALKSTNEIVAGARQTIKSLLIFSSILLLFFIVLISLYLQKLIKPLEKTTLCLEHISNGDITQHVESHFEQKKDEIGKIAKSLNQMTQTLNKTLSQVQSSSGYINTNVHHSVDAMYNLNSNLEEISCVTEEMAAGAEETAASADQMLETTKGIQEQVNTISGHAEKHHAEAITIKNELIKNIEFTQNHQVNTHTLLEKTKNQLDQALNEIKVVYEIQGFLSSIENITEQTNLLALNAAVESARAGIAGNGFNVISTEIRTLADYSKQEVDKIQKVIVRVLDAVNHLSKTSEELIEFVSNDLKEYYSIMNNVTDKYRVQSQLTEQMSLDFKDKSLYLSNQVNTIIESINQITMASNETALGSTDIALKVNNIKDHSNEIEEKLAETKQNVDTLDSQVKKFKLS